jgi:hypothetical protein
MVANEVNKFGQIFPIHSRRKYKDVELFRIKYTPHFFFQTYFRLHITYYYFQSNFVLQLKTP